MVRQFDDETLKLLSLLDTAVEEMLSYGNQSTFSYFATCEDVGLYIRDIIIKAKAGDLHELSKLWYLFAPTSVWDDSGGSQEIANEIFEIINTKFKPE